MGADVVGHGAVCLQSEPDEGPEPVPENKTSSHRSGFGSETPENSETWPEKVSTSPGGS